MKEEKPKIKTAADIAVENPAKKVEIYPEFYTTAKTSQYKKVFASNSTFVTFSHLIRTLLGPTILAIPQGFKMGGLVFSSVVFFFLLFLVAYNMQRLIKAASYLSERENINVRTYEELAYVAFDTCSPKTKRFAFGLKVAISLLFFITHLDACVIFIIFVARNVEALKTYFFPYGLFELRHFIFFQIFLLMCMSTIRELKNLSPFSLTASILLISVMIILIAAFLSKETHLIKERSLIGSPTMIIHFVNVVLFCNSGLSIALTLKSGMKHPEKFLGFPGLFYMSVTFVGTLFIIFGFLGYTRYGEETYASILLNVPCDSTLGVCVKIMAIVGVMLTCPLVFYVAFNVLWNSFIKKYFTSVNVLFSEYFIRFLLIVLSSTIALIFPDLGKMIVLKGGLFHSHLELTIPSILEFVTFYPENGTGRYHLRLIKMVCLVILGFFFFVGSISVAIIEWDLQTED